MGNITEKTYHDCYNCTNIYGNICFKTQGNPYLLNACNNLAFLLTFLFIQHASTEFDEKACYNPVCANTYLWCQGGKVTTKCQILTCKSWFCSTSWIRSKSRSLFALPSPAYEKAAPKARGACERGAGTDWAGLFDARSRGSLSEIVFHISTDKRSRFLSRDGNTIHSISAWS